MYSEYMALKKQYENSNSLMSKKIKLVAYYIKENGTLLDIGCGTGDFLLKMIERFKYLIGCDVNPKAIELRKARMRQYHHLDLIICDAHALPFRSSSINYITALDVLEHLEEPHKAIKETFFVLKEGGKLIITTPNWYDKIIRRLRNSHHKCSHSSIGWRNMVSRLGYKPLLTRTVDFPVIHSKVLCIKFHLLGKCVLNIFKK